MRRWNGFDDRLPTPQASGFLMTVYGAGLRLDEACHLKTEHLNRARMQIRVVQGKGRKDRYTLLSPKLLRKSWRDIGNAFAGALALSCSVTRQAPMTTSRAEDFYTAVKREACPQRRNHSCDTVSRRTC